ncbi:uncharacterized protein LOC123222914 [Mangifera indica]|uniref:uncharacterized protein LOC123222914 n=1 Tax=Mangifera indica TaxID=29780 RepID=UPI001CF9EACB|nr:uncharacterized protein LOC123222914 [Mangifera indica]
MNGAMKGAIFNLQSQSQLRLAMFHSTPVLERKRRRYWQTPGFSHDLGWIEHWFSVGLAGLGFKIASWRDDLHEDDPLTSKGPSWFKKQYCGRSKNNWNQGRQYWDRKRVLGSLFGRSGCFYCSFINEENTKWKSSSNNYYSYTNYRNWKAQFEEEYESSTESDNLDPDMASNRLALGLSAYGPLKLEEVKIKYRACALKWHPDRHQGSSKVVAEEKFKLCSQAYRSLCDKLGVN